MGPGGKPIGNRYMGQNLAAGWPTSSLSWKGAINAWDYEKKDYRICSNSKNGKAMVGHYKQIVWQETTHVGCGRAECPNLEGSGPGVLITCNYWPGGNMRECRAYETKCGGSNRPKVCDGSDLTENKCEPALDDSKLDEGSDSSSSSARLSAIRSLIFLTTGLIAYIVF